MKKNILILSLLITLSALANCDVENIISKTAAPNTNYQIQLIKLENGSTLYNQVVPLNEDVRNTLEEASKKGKVSVCLQGTRMNRTFFAYSASY